MEGVLATEMMQETQSNLENQGNPSFLKDDFSSKTDPLIFTSIAPELLDWSIEQVDFFQHLNHQVTFCSSLQCLLGQIQIQNSNLVVIL